MKPASRERLLVVLNRGGVNGAVRQLGLWLPHMGRWFETTVAFLRDRGPWGPRLLPAGATVWEGLLRSRFDAIGSLRFVGRAWRFRPHVVFSIDERNATVLARLVGLLTGARVVHAIHSTPARAVLPWWDRVTSRWVARYVAVSEGHRRALEGMGVSGDRIAVVLNGVPVQPPRLRPVAPEAVTLAFVGVLRRDKRVDLLLDALARAGARVPGLRALIAGDGPERTALEAKARALGITARVTWRGWVEDASEVLRDADFFVLPSDPGVETLSMAALEAMALGLPVIATDVGSMREAITPEVGILVAPGDVEALSGAIVELSTDHERRRRLGEAALRWQRERFSSDRLVGAMHRVLARDWVPVTGPRRERG